MKKRFGPYESNAGHLFYVDYETSDQSKRSVLVHREMMEIHVGRKLTDEEVVHHINGNPQDNRIENFQILTPSAHASLHRRPPEVVESVCPECGETFFALMRYVKHNQINYGKEGPFCSKSCAGRWSRRKQIENGVGPRRRAGHERGCKCDLCKKSHRDAMRSYRERKKQFASISQR